MSDTEKLLKEEKAYDYVKQILDMKEWKDEKFSELLTPTIWKNKYKTIQAKLNLKYQDNNDYQHLLVPSIFSISIENIEKKINLFEEYNIGKYITNRCLRRNINELRNLLEYMICNDISLIVDDSKGGLKLNPILNATNKEIKEKYGIDVKNLGKKGVGSVK